MFRIGGHENQNLAEGGHDELSGDSHARPLPGEGDIDARAPRGFPSLHTRTLNPYPGTEIKTGRGCRLDSRGETA